MPRLGVIPATGFAGAIDILLASSCKMADSHMRVEIEEVPFKGVPKQFALNGLNRLWLSRSRKLCRDIIGMTAMHMG